MSLEHLHFLPSVLLHLHGSGSKFLENPSNMPFTPLVPDDSLTPNKNQEQTHDCSSQLYSKTRSITSYRIETSKEAQNCLNMNKNEVGAEKIYHLMDCW